MAKKDWVWMGRAAHFIAAERCHFRLATYIPSRRVIVSTIGDYDPGVGIACMKRPHDIGCDRKYETFVFEAKAVKDCDGCAYHVDPPSEIDSLPANTANDAAWEDDWRWIVFINLPAGQASWHIHDSELQQFDHLPRKMGRKWDGHSNEEKYRRLELLALAAAHPAPEEK